MNRHNVLRTAILLATLLIAPSLASATIWVSDNTGLPGAEIDLTVSINTVTDAVEFTVTSSNTAVWQGIGFGNTFMSSTYAIIMFPDGSAQERIMGNHNSGSLTTLATLESVVRTDNGDGTVTFTMTRPVTPNIVGVFNFPTDGSPVSMIRARGTGPALSYHGFSNKSVGSIVFEEDTVTGIDDSPAVFVTSLHNSPNPFNPSTEFRFFQENPGRAIVHIYDMRGKSIQTIDAGRLNNGPQAIHWDGTDTKGLQMSSGVYFYRLTINGQPAGNMNKMTLLK
jgi:hypothetical protein